jgi:hypothetical protein
MHAAEFAPIFECAISHYDSGACRFGNLQDFLDIHYAGADVSFTASARRSTFR